MKEQDTTEDFFLLAQVRQGDSQSFEILFQRYWESLYTAAYHRLNSRAEAQEVVQSLFVSLWQRREQLKVSTSLKAYLFASLRYTILDHIRAQTVREKYVQSICQRINPSNNATAETVAYRELENSVHRGIDALPQRCGLVFRLRRLEQYSVKEIAQLLGISPKTVENQLTKATKALRLHLRDYVTIVGGLIALLP